MHQPNEGSCEQIKVFFSSSIMRSHSHHFNYSATVTCYLCSSRPLAIVGLVLLKGGHQTLRMCNGHSAVCCVHKGEAANCRWRERSEKQSFACLDHVKTQTFTGSPAQHSNHWATAPAKLSNHNSYMRTAKRQSLQYCPCVHTARKC